VLEKLFPDWNIRLLANQWIWAKVTTAGEPVFDLRNPTRHPYESQWVASVDGDLSGDADLVIGQWGPEMPSLDLPRQKVLVSVPLGHSRKPCVIGSLLP
jgi:hypothetical protein